MNNSQDHLMHYGRLGMKWGVMNGPPYPLGASDHSASEKKAAVTFRDAAEQGRGFICRTVVLHQDGKIRISLRSQRFQQGWQMSAAIVRGQQNGSLYHVIPHFRKYLKTETIWRIRPLKVRVFSRAHLWVTHISGW